MVGAVTFTARTAAGDATGETDGAADDAAMGAAAADGEAAGEPEPPHAAAAAATTTERTATRSRITAYLLEIKERVHVLVNRSSRSRRADSRASRPEASGRPARG